LDAARTRVPEGDYPLVFEYPPELDSRRKDTGYGLYRVLGIARDDMPARQEQFLRNFELFDAPNALFLFAHEALGIYGALDAGIFLQSIMLAALELGVQTCAQASLACFPDVVRRHFEIPDGYRLLCGISLGYAVPDPVNDFRPGRVSVDDVLMPVRVVPLPTETHDPSSGLPVPDPEGASRRGSR
jgi:nitroreductase